MAWATEILSKTRKADGVLSVDVRFADGKNTFVERFDLHTQDLAQFQQRVRDRIGHLNSLDSADLIAVGPFDPGVNPQPDAADVEFRTWKRKFDALVVGEQLKTLGVITGSEPAYTSLQSDVRNSFRATFIAKL